MNAPARRMIDVQTPVIPVVGKLIAEHPGTISLGQGVVHYGPPPEAAAAVAEFFSDGDNHQYKLVDGTPELQTAIAAKLRDDNGITLDDDRAVVVTAGGNMAFINALYAVADPGDEVILLRPYYFNHEMAIRMVGATPVIVDTDENHQPDVAAIEAAMTDRTRMVVTVSPNNPTGAVYSEAALRAINDLCRRRGVYHVTDEAYEYFTYDGAPHFSPGAIDGAAGHTISLFSLSKAYGFASWRIGYMVIPRDLLMSVKKAQDTILICPPVIGQMAAAAALRVGRAYCEPFVADLGALRREVIAMFEPLGDRVTLRPATGAFYFMLELPGDRDPMAVVETLVREHRVAAIPGSTFGAAGCTLRIAYGALRRDTITEGIGRLLSGLESI